MIERNDEELMLDGFIEYLRNCKGLQQKSVRDDISRINMMKTVKFDGTIN